jgi:hypothetical protein
VQEPLMQSTQFTRPQPHISEVPTHDHTNERADQQSRQTPLQYLGSVFKRILPRARATRD